MSNRSTKGPKPAKGGRSAENGPEKRDGLVKGLIALLVVLTVIIGALGVIKLNDIPSWLTGMIGTIIGHYFTPPRY